MGTEAHKRAHSSSPNKHARNLQRAHRPKERVFVYISPEMDRFQYFSRAQVALKARFTLGQVLQEVLSTAQGIECAHVL